MLAALTICHAQVVDIGVKSIVWPRGVVYVHYSAHPSAQWRNHGTVEVEFRAWLSIYDTLGVLDYIDSTSVDHLAPKQSTRLYFREYTPACCTTGPLRWTVRCSTYAASDANDTNDVLTDSFQIRMRPI
jgi:hypothetical protein